MPSQPEGVARVEAVLDGQVVGSAAADQMRPDLAEHSKGTGRYGFVLGFQEPITGDKAPLLRVIGPEGPTILPGGVDVLPPADPAPTWRETLLEGAMASGASPPLIEGHVDILTRDGASGWAWVPASPRPDGPD